MRFEEARTALGTWMREHAHSDDDLREGSRLVAQFVAAAVRRDRATVAISEKTAELMAKMREFANQAEGPL